MGVKHKVRRKNGKLKEVDLNSSSVSTLDFLTGSKELQLVSLQGCPKRLGGAIAGLGIHMIDLMCSFGGKVKSVQSLVKRFAVKVNMDDTTSALFEFKKNCTGNLNTIFACPYNSSFNIFGTNMNIFSDVDKNKIKIININGKKYEIELPNKNTLFLELQEFADCCKNKKKFRIKNLEAAHNVEIMEAIVKSSKQNKKIYL